MFSDVIKSLPTENQATLTNQLDQWQRGSCSRARRIAENINDETALSIDAFFALLEDFCAELKRIPADAISGWESACRRHKFKGAPIPSPVPTRFGRALPIDRYAKLLAPSVGLTDAKVEAMIRKVALAGSSPVPREARLLRRSRIGEFVIWATFREGKSDENPFAHLPNRTEAIRNALGLGECPETETLVLISWRREGPLANLSIHRPTVADAEAYPWYRHVRNPAAKWGYTSPLIPNRDNLPPCPEVVHQEITGETLVFPVLLTT